MDSTGKNFVKVLLFLTGIVLITFSLSSCSTSTGNSWLEEGAKIFTTLGDGKGKKELTIGEIGEAFKDALRIGTTNVVSQLGRRDGFKADPAIHIPLPKEFTTVKNMLSTIGMANLLDDLELKLNRAAEAATPRAKTIFLQAITAMTFEDAMAIYKGPEDAATQYFQGKMTPLLAKEMHPIVEQSLSQVGAVQAYDNVMGQYQSLPFVPDVKADLTTYVVEKGMGGIFYYIAQEEAAIRRDPAKRTTELLKRLFGPK